MARMSFLVDSTPYTLPHVIAGGIQCCPCESAWRGHSQELVPGLCPLHLFPWLTLISTFLLHSMVKVTLRTFLTSVSPISTSSNLRVPLGTPKYSGMHRREIKTRHPQHNTLHLPVREGSHHLLFRGLGRLCGLIVQQV